MSVTNDAASDPSGESMDASTMAASMRPRSAAGITCWTKWGRISSARGTGSPALRSLSYGERGDLLKAIAKALREHREILGGGGARAERLPHKAERPQHRPLPASWQERGQRRKRRQQQAKKGKISITSPLARALLGKRKNNIVEVSTPGGGKSYKVLKVEFK